MDENTALATLSAAALDGETWTMTWDELFPFFRLRLGGCGWP